MTTKNKFLIKTLVQCFGETKTIELLNQVRKRSIKRKAKKYKAALNRYKVAWNCINTTYLIKNLLRYHKILVKYFNIVLAQVLKKQNSNKELSEFFCTLQLL